MSKDAYCRKPGDFEVRILPDGRVIFVAPDERMMDVVRELDPQHLASSEKEKKEHDRSEAGE